jgi:hypothetical protein
MIEAISFGITDYLARHPDSFGQLVDTILDERDRLMRWQYAILSETFARATKNNEPDDKAVSPGGPNGKSDGSPDTGP